MVTTIDKLEISMLYNRAIQKSPYIICCYFMTFSQKCQNLQKHIMSATMARIADNNRQKNFIK